MGHADFVSAVTLYAKTLPYDPLKSLKPVSMVGTGVTVLVIIIAAGQHRAEFIAYAKRKGDLSYASAGNGTISHLTGELLKSVTGVPLLHIPYKSAGFALTAVLSGEVPVSFLSPVTAHGQLKAGKVRALAVSSAARFPGAPDIPSAVEAGIGGMEATLLVRPFRAGKTRCRVRSCEVEWRGGGSRAEDAQETFLAQGIAATPSSPEELELGRGEVALWTPMIQRAGIRAD